MTKKLNELGFTPEAVAFLYRKGTRMRNTYTEQVLLFHLSKNRSNNVNGSRVISGHYSMPLWTIATPQLFCDIQSNKFEQEQYMPIDYVLENYTASQLKLEEAHLANYLQKIRQSIVQYTTFGISFNHFYDYELLLENSETYDLGDFKYYPTGGRCYGEFNNKTILARICFETAEVEFFKDILKGRHDAFIKKDLQFQVDIPDETFKSYRLRLCNILATEIILSKLILFINAYALTSKPLLSEAFSPDELKFLLDKSLAMGKIELQSIIDKCEVSLILGSYSLYLTVQKYTLPKTESDYVMVGEEAVDKEATINPNEPASSEEKRTQETKILPIDKPNVCGFFTKTVLVSTLGLTLCAAAAAIGFTNG